MIKGKYTTYGEFGLLPSGSIIECYILYEKNDMVLLYHPTSIEGYEIFMIARCCKDGWYDYGDIKGVYINKDKVTNKQTGKEINETIQ